MVILSAEKQRLFDGYIKGLMTASIFPSHAFTCPLSFYRPQSTAWGAGWRKICGEENFSFLFLRQHVLSILLKVSQKERSIFREVTVSVILSKEVYMYTCIFRTVSEIELYHCTVPKLFIGKGYYVLFLISVFIVQATKVGIDYLV
jgi:hypothetical protein